MRLYEKNAIPFELYLYLYLFNVSSEKRLVSVIILPCFVTHDG